MQTILLNTMGQLLMPLFGLTVFALGIYAIVNVMQRQDLTETERLRWMIGIVILPVIGPLFYLISGRK